MERQPPSGGRGDGSRDRAEEKVYRVGELTREVRAALERRWADVWIEGEVCETNVSPAGHAYFALKDAKEDAQIKVVMFRTDLARSRARIADGALVKLRGMLSVYGSRGTFQLQARIALPAGQGLAALALAKLREKLAAEGLFDPARKRPLPRVPRCVGLVTSPTGAALHDVVRVASARFPVRIVLSPTMVQGEDAPRQIVNALRAIHRIRDLDVIIVGRGGGGAEDLAAFNDERVARAIAKCRVPVVSAVGHEVDVTIADLVADVRAATPSNAAELVVPERVTLLADLRALEGRLARAMEGTIARRRVVLVRVSRRVRDPRRLVTQSAQRIDDLQQRAIRAWRRRLRTQRTGLDDLRARLALLDPQRRLREARRQMQQLGVRLAALPVRLVPARRNRMDALSARLRAAPVRLLERRRAALETLTARMMAIGARIADRSRGPFERLVARVDALSPLAILGRGYAIALVERTGLALRRASDAQPGEALRIRLGDGSVRARVEGGTPVRRAAPRTSPSGDRQLGLLDLPDETKEEESSS